MRRLEGEGDYFSEDSMRHRAPLLYHQHIGRYAPPHRPPGQAQEQEQGQEQGPGVAGGSEAQGDEDAGGACVRPGPSGAAWGTRVQPGGAGVGRRGAAAGFASCACSSLVLCSCRVLHDGMRRRCAACGPQVRAALEAAALPQHYSRPLQRAATAPPRDQEQ